MLAYVADGSKPDSYIAANGVELTL
jgi:hypothetical protein